VPRYLVPTLVRRQNNFGAFALENQQHQIAPQFEKGER